MAARSTSGAGPATAFRFSQVAEGPPGKDGDRGPPGPSGTGGGGQFNVALVNGLNSNVNTNDMPVIRVGGPTAAFSIGGLAPATTWAGGQRVTVINTTAFPMTIVQEDTSSTAGYRINTLSGSQDNVVCPPRTGAATFVYDGNASRFVLEHNGWKYQNELNVKDFGAKGDGTTDDTIAIQAAIDATPAFGVLYFPEGNYIQTGPLRVHARPINIRGPRGPTTGGLAGGAILHATAATNAAHPSQNIWCGPQLIVGGESQPYPVTVSGNFNVLNFNGLPTSGNTICLTESDCGSINGLGTGAGTGPGTGFTFEIWLDMLGTNPPEAIPVGVSGGGGVIPAGPAVSAFQVNINNGFHVAVHLKTTGGTLDFASVATFPSSGLTHLAVTYDQSNVRVFINGVLNGADVHAATGTIVQDVAEDFTIGYRSGTWPLGIAFGNSGRINIASMRLSSRAVYTSTFTPSTTELDTGANDCCLCLMNFSPANMVFGGSWVTAYSTRQAGRHHAPPGDPVYIYLGHNASLPTVASGTNVSDLNFFAGVGGYGTEGMYVHDCNSVTVENVTMNSASKGITFLGGYWHRVKRCFIGVGASTLTSHCWPVGFLDNPGGVLNVVEHCAINGGQVTFMAPAGGAFYDNFINNCPTYAGIYSVNALPNLGALVMRNNLWDDESSPTLLAGAVIVGMTYVDLQGNGWPGSGQSNCNLYQLGNCGDVDIADDWTLLGVSVPGVIKFTSPFSDGSIVTVHVPYNEQSHAVPIVDPAGPGPVVVLPREMFGRRVKNFAADADMLLTGDDELFSLLDITDSAVHLTTARNVKFPFLTDGYRRMVVNRTAQSLTFKGLTGTGVTVAAGGTALIRCDGTNWLPTIGGSGAGTSGSQTFTSSGTFNVPAGVTQVELVGWGNGGAGGGGDGVNNPGSITTQHLGGGGAGGAAEPKTVKVAVTPLASITVTIPAAAVGGAGQTGSGAVQGAVGGDVTFGALATFSGGSGGGGANAGGGTAGFGGASFKARGGLLLLNASLGNNTFPTTGGTAGTGGNGGGSSGFEGAKAASPGFDATLQVGGSFLGGTAGATGTTSTNVGGYGGGGGGGGAGGAAGAGGAGGNGTSGATGANGSAGGNAAANSGAGGGGGGAGGNGATNAGNGAAGGNGGTGQITVFW